MLFNLVSVSKTNHENMEIMSILKKLTNNSSMHLQLTKVQYQSCKYWLAQYDFCWQLSISTSREGTKTGIWQGFLLHKMVSFYFSCLWNELMFSQEPFGCPRVFITLSLQVWAIDVVTQSITPIRNIAELTLLLGIQFL